MKTKKTPNCLNDFIEYKKGAVGRPKGKPTPNPITKQPGCYVITHTQSGKMYVGSSVNLAARISGNMNLLKHGKHKNKNLQNLFEQDPNLTAVLKITENEETARKLEQHIVDELNPTGVLCNIAVIDVMKTKTGVPLSQEHRRILLEANKDRVVTTESKERMRQSHLGNKLSEDTKRKLSTSHKEFYATEAGKLVKENSIAKIRKPTQINGTTYASRAEASEKTGVSIKTILKRCASEEYPDWISLSPNGDTDNE